MEDKELYELIINNSEEGLYQLICKYKGFVWNITNRVLSGRYQDIEECVSDVFFRFWSHRHTLDMECGSIKGLLACMARNTAINRYNRIKKEKKIVFWGGRSGCCCCYFLHDSYIHDK